MFGWLFWTKGQWFPWESVFTCYNRTSALVIWHQLGVQSWACKGVEEGKGYVRHRSQSQQKWVSSCWADNVKEVSGTGLMLPAWPVQPAPPSRKYLPRVSAQLFWFGSVKYQSRFVVVAVLTRQITAVSWNLAQAWELLWDCITVGFPNLSLDPVTTITPCLWTNYIPSLSLSFLRFKGDAIIGPLYSFVRIIEDNAWKHLISSGQSQLSINRSYDYFISICLLK